MGGKGEVRLDRERPLPLRFRVLRIDGNQVEHIGGAEEIADAPLNGLLARPEEQQVLVLEIREQLEDPDVPVVGILVGGLDLAEDPEIPLRPGVEEQIRGQPGGEKGSSFVEQHIPGIGIAVPDHLSIEEQVEAAPPLQPLGNQEGLLRGGLPLFRGFFEDALFEQIRLRAVCLCRCFLRAAFFCEDLPLE